MNNFHRLFVLFTNFEVNNMTTLKEDKKWIQNIDKGKTNVKNNDDSETRKPENAKEAESKWMNSSVLVYWSSGVRAEKKFKCSIQI